MPLPRQKRKLIPQFVLKKIDFTERWTKKRVKKLISLWNDLDNTIQDIMDDLGVEKDVVMNKVDSIREHAGLTSDATQGMSISRPENKSHAGWKKCMRCGIEFYSWHIKKNRRCDACKIGNQESDVDNAVQLPFYFEEW